MATLWYTVSSLCLFIVICHAQRKFDDIVGQNQTMKCDSPFGGSQVGIAWFVTDLDGTRVVYPGVVSPKYIVSPGIALALCGSVPCLPCTTGSHCYVELTVVSLEVKDSGTHTCTFTRVSDSNAASTQFNIDVLDLPNEIYVTRKLGDSTTGQKFEFNQTLGSPFTRVPVTENQEVTIDFVVSDSYPAANVKCTVNIPVEESVTIANGTEQYTKTVTTSLKFTAAKQLNNIPCSVDLNHASYPQATFNVQIDVQYPPEGTVSFQVMDPNSPTSTDDATGLATYEVQVDQKLKFRCQIGERGNPKGKLGLVLEGTDSQIIGNILETSNNEFEFTVESYEQSGQYRCSVANDLASQIAPTSEKIEIKVTGGRSTISNSTKTTVTGRVGQDLMVKAKFCSRPRARRHFWSWKNKDGKNETLIAHREEQNSGAGGKLLAHKVARDESVKICHLSESVLQIVDAQEEDSRVYRFVVMNSIGGSHVDITVRVESPSLSTSAILGIIFALLVVICIVIAIVAYVKKIWCFKKSSSSSTNYTPAGADEPEKEDMNMTSSP